MRVCSATTPTMVRVAVFAATAALCVPAAAVIGAHREHGSLPWIRTSDTDHHFYDEFGRVRIFHGSNRVRKEFPWYYPEMSDPDSGFLEKFSRLGFNVIRLGWMWTGFNPSEGYFNETYAREVVKLVDRLADHGVYTLLDMHQDVFSSKYCLYDGVPLWVVNKSTPRHPFPWPLKGDCLSRSWGLNWAAEASSHAAQDLYDNTNGMLDDMANFWKRSAEIWANKPSVIGYDIINEPWAGDFYEDPLIMVPGEAGKRNLQPMYDYIAKAIRPVDEEHIIFYEPVTWGMIFNGTVSGSGFTQVPGGPDFRNRSAFNFHYYCDTFLSDYEDKLEEAKIICDEIAGPEVFRAVFADVDALGGAVFMSEGLACVDKAMDECRAVNKMQDDHFVSYTDYGDAQDHPWSPSALQLEAWTRVYARAIAGRPTNMSFAAKDDSRDFALCFVPNPTITAPTEIFLGSRTNYPHGATVECGEGLTCQPSQIQPSNLTAPPVAGKDDVLLVTVNVPLDREGLPSCVRISGLQA